MKKFVDLHNKLAETLEQGQQVAKHSRMPQLIIYQIALRVLVHISLFSAINLVARPR